MTNKGKITQPTSYEVDRRLSIAINRTREAERLLNDYERKYINLKNQHQALKNDFKKQEYLLNAKLVRLAVRIQRYLHRNQGRKHVIVLSALARSLLHIRNAWWRIRQLLSSRKAIREIEATYKPFNSQLRDLGLSKEGSLYLKHIFFPKYYAFISGLENRTDTELFKHFITTGIKNGAIPSPLFNQEFYKKTAKSFGMDDIENNPFLHWIRFGAAERIVPTPLFNEKFYNWKYPAIKKSFDWGFKHYLLAGIYENRSPNNLFDPAWYKRRYAIKSDYPLFLHYLTIGHKRGYRASATFPIGLLSENNISPLESIILSSNTSDIRQRLEGQPILLDIINKTAAIEPAIISKNSFRAINRPPYNKSILPVVKQVRCKLPKPHYDIIVLVPHSRMGGASLVAGLTTHALHEAFPEKNVLLVLTDRSVFERGDWYHPRVDMIDLNHHFSDAHENEKQLILLDLLFGATPQTVININSRLGWDLFKRYSERLSCYMDLYGYYFCYDVDRLGRKVGYPISTFRETCHHMSGYFFDNRYLKQYLSDTFPECSDSQEKLHVLYTPSSETNKRHTSKAPGEKVTIFWAGRFDRQKRFDILIDIAKELPNFSFWVWGKAVLDNPVDMDKLPENIVHKGTFNHFDELPFEECTLWLYTSEWDGLPTTLIEVGKRGIPIVGSKVGGTADLLSDQTAWPVDDINSPKAYTSKIRQLLKAPQTIQKRTDAMRELISVRHNMHTYAAQFKQILGKKREP